MVINIRLYCCFGDELRFSDILFFIWVLCNKCWSVKFNEWLVKYDRCFVILFKFYIFKILVVVMVIVVFDLIWWRVDIILVFDVVLFIVWEVWRSKFLNCCLGLFCSVWMNDKGCFRISCERNGEFLVIDFK